MSGPKSSKYTLTPEQRRALEEQRRRERRINAAREKIKSSNQRILAIGGRFSADRAIAEELLRSGAGDGGFADLLSQLPAAVAPAGEDVESLEKLAKNALISAEKAEKIAEKLTVLSAENEVKLKKDLGARIDRGFSSSFADLKNEKKNPRKKQLFLRLETLRREDALPVEYRQEAENALRQLTETEDEVFLKNYEALTVRPLVKKCEAFLAVYREIRSTFTEAEAEYRALCDQHYYVAQKFPCTREGLAEMQAEIRRIKAESAAEEEEAYISDSLDAVMEEMGYSVLGRREVTKKNGKHFRSELYTYGEGTAVNVTYSADGRIAMELGGVDGCDRLPSAAEAASLCREMERFCGDFKEIERRLATRGVIPAGRLTMLPPDPAHAQIINTADYNMTGKVPKTAKRKKKTTRKTGKSVEE